MSKAFTKETDDAPIELPEREISSFPNLVTPQGLAQLDASIERESAANAAALAADDREAVSRAARDLRYWTARRHSAQIQHPPADAGIVSFGSRVEIQRADGRRAVWRIVGEDEADPAKGLLSWVSPLARAMMGKCAGDAVEAGATQAEIVSVSV